MTERLSTLARTESCAPASAQRGQSQPWEPHRLRREEKLSERELAGNRC